MLESIPIGLGHPTFDLFEDCQLNMDEFIEHDTVMEEYRKEAINRISLFVRLSGSDLNITSYGEIGLIAINHKEQEFGIILFHDEDDERPLKDMHRSNLIGTVFGLIPRKEAFF